MTRLSPRVELAVALTWLFLAFAEVAVLVHDGSTKIVAAAVAWLGGYLSPYVAHAARCAYREARA